MKKLVRDLIPEIIKSEGREVEYDTLVSLKNEYKEEEKELFASYLKEKLIEETTELKEVVLSENLSIKNIENELADVYEVIAFFRNFENIETPYQSLSKTRELSEDNNYFRIVIDNAKNDTILLLTKELERHSEIIHKGNINKDSLIDIYTILRMFVIVFDIKTSIESLAGKKRTLKGGFYRGIVMEF